MRHVGVVEVIPFVVECIFGKGGVVAALEAAKLVADRVQVVEHGWGGATLWPLDLVRDQERGHVQPVDGEVHMVGELARPTENRVALVVESL